MYSFLYISYALIILSNTFCTLYSTIKLSEGSIITLNKDFCPQDKRPSPVSIWLLLIPTSYSICLILKLVSYTFLILLFCLCHLYLRCLVSLTDFLLPKCFLSCDLYNHPKERNMCPVPLSLSSWVLFTLYLFYSSFQQECKLLKRRVHIFYKFVIYKAPSSYIQDDKILMKQLRNISRSFRNNKTR